jgi:hypothetical protein
MDFNFKILKIKKKLMNCFQKYSFGLLSKSDVIFRIHECPIMIIKLFVDLRF